MSPEIWPVLLGGVLMTALLVYTLTGGADFGGGVWDLLARGPRKGAQRREIASALAPIWEANHVWLIVVVVVLFVCFPGVFAAISTALHIPLSLMLIGIVLRGSAFVFRAYDPQASLEGGLWARIFAISSTLTPVFLGICLGAVARGLTIDPATGLVQTDFVSDWLAPFPFLLGLTNLGLCATLAAVYLAHRCAAQPALQRDFVVRGLAAAVVTGGWALAALAVARTDAPWLFAALTDPAQSLLPAIAASTLAMGAMLALWRRHTGLARVLVVAQVCCFFGAWSLAQYPLLLPPNLDIWTAAAPVVILRPVFLALCLGLAVLGPAFVGLYWVFRHPSASKHPPKDTPR